MYEKKVELTKRDRLVDPTHLLEYLPDDPSELTFKTLDGFKNHHIYFPEADFTNKTGRNRKRPEDLDEAIVYLRASPYNQVYMRVDLEDRYHKDHEEHVPVPDVEIAKKFCRDERRIDVLGALSIGLHKNSYNGYFKHTKAGQKIKKDKLEFFETKREEAYRDIFRIEVMPRVVVVSAIKRMAIKLGDPWIHGFANEPLDENETYLPLKIPSHKSFRVIADRMFASHVALAESSQAENEFLIARPEAALV